MTARAIVGFVGVVLLASACGGGGETAPPPQTPSAPVTAEIPGVAAPPVVPAKPTAEDAARFVEEVDKELRRLWVWGSRASWVKQNFITYDTNALAADAEEASMAYLGKVIPEAAKFDVLELPPLLRRQLDKLNQATMLPAPTDPAKRKELATISTELDSMYGAGKYCPKTSTVPQALGLKASKLLDKKDPDACLDLEQLTKIIEESRDWDTLAEAWAGWRTIARPMRPMYERLVTLGNEGAREIGYADLGALWNSAFDMTPQEFEQDAERLWTEVKPLYEQLHCYVRGKLRAKHGKDRIPEKGPIPAHLLGNMWAQDWTNLYDQLEPYKGQPSLDVTKAMKAKKWDERKVVRTAEQFFVGLGLDPLPQTFWERSLFEKPRDREVVCHASAWDVSFSGDLRIKMCVRVNEEDLGVAHHELGHVYYFHYYNQLPILLQDGANKGFHEGIGDTIALSVTPRYLKDLGLVAKVPADAKGDLNVLMKMALQKVAFLPFGKLVDQWRWDVFAGRTKPAQYNARWWELRTKYQGVSAPVARSEEDFDPGAKFHVPANVSYTRYFLAHVYQFQFHRALCKVAGHAGPLHQCSIAGSKAAGDRLKSVLAMGATKPWPEAMQALTGETRADATALLDYFAPLLEWLKKQNEGQTCGW